MTEYQSHNKHTLARFWLQKAIDAVAAAESLLVKTMRTTNCSVRIYQKKNVEVELLHMMVLCIPVKVSMHACKGEHVCM